MPKIKLKKSLKKLKKKEKGIKKDLKVIKEKKKKPKKTQEDPNKSFFITGLIVVVLFLGFITWQILFSFKSHFVSILPEEYTDFVIDFYSGPEYIQNNNLRNLLLKRVLGEDVLIDLLDNKNQKFLLNKNYNLGLAKINEDFVFGVSPLDFQQEKLLEMISPYLKEEDSLNEIMAYKLLDLDFYSIKFKNFLLFSKNKKTLLDLVYNNSSKANLSYKALLNRIPNREYFKPINLVFLRPDVFLNKALGDFKLEGDISLKTLLTKDLDLSSLVGQIKSSHNSLNISLRNKEFKMNTRNNLMDKKTEKVYTYNCPVTNNYSFSGFDLASSWKKKQIDFKDQSFSLLQSLSSRLIEDIYSKTDFDLEKELVMKANDYYCFNVVNKDTEKEYLLVLENNKDFKKEEFIKNAQLSFLRLAPFSKPLLREYTLIDGTKAQEFIVDLNQDIENKLYKYKDIRIKSVKFLEEYSHSFNVAEIGDLLLITTDFDLMKDAIDFYKENNIKNNSALETIEFNSKNLMLNQKLKKLEDFQLLNEFNLVSFSKGDDDIYKIELFVNK